MKGFFRFGWFLTFGLVATPLFAQEGLWRPASVTLKPPTSATTQPLPAARVNGAEGLTIGLRAPVPLEATTATTGNQGIKPVAFRPVPIQQPSPVFRAKPDDNPRPLPVGPTVIAEPVSRQESLQGPVKADPALRNDTFKKVEEIPFAPRTLGRTNPNGTLLSGPVLHSGPVIVNDNQVIIPDPCDCNPICSNPICGDCPPCPDLCDCCGGGWPGDCCLPRGCWWISAEYLMWWFNRPNIPPLVTSSPRTTPDATAGILGNSTILFDGNRLTDNERSGFRLNAGFWFPWCPDYGLEATYFHLGRNSESFIFSGGDKIARPFTDLTTGAGKQNREPVNFAGLAGGSSVRVDFSNYLWGIEANLRQKFWCCPWGHLDFLCGYRHVEFFENLAISEDLATAVGNNPFTLQDRFETKNRFDGFQMGVDGECRLCWGFWLGCKAKIAFGNMRQSLFIDGFTNPVNPGSPAPVFGSGGLLALPTNLGTFNRNRFAVIPEVNLKLGYDITPCWRVWIGYDFLLLSDVLRPGDQIDLGINTNYRPIAAPPGPGPGGFPRRPTVLFQSSTFWAQGLNFGMEWRY